MNSDLESTPLYLIYLALTNQPPTLEDVQAFTDYLDFQAAASVAGDGEGRFQASSYTGYLKFEIEKNAILVPAHLAPLFPTGNNLEAAISVAKKVALVSANPICISGSATTLGSIEAVADLDFCEYHLGSYSELPKLAYTKTSSPLPFPLIEIKAGKGKFTAPWDMVTAQEIGGAFHAQPEESVEIKMKLDFISETALGLLPSTSVIVPMQSPHKTGASENSFAFQEAVITQNGPPLPLDNAEQFARYAAWLLTEAEKFIAGASTAETKLRSKYATKALKRLLSFLLLINQAELVEEVMQGLNHSVVIRVVNQGRHDELSEMCALTSGKNQIWLKEKITQYEQKLENLVLVSEVRDEAVDELLALASNIIEEIRLLLQQVGGSA